MTFSGDKLDLKIYGFNEKLPVLASKCAELLTSLVAREDRFQVIIELSNFFLSFWFSFWGSLSLNFTVHVENSSLEILRKSQSSRSYAPTQVGDTMA